jgi:DNA-binding NarL/FixJ family response regulator
MFDQLPENSGDTIEVGIVEGNHSLGESLRQTVDSIPDTRCIGVWSTAEIGLKKIEAFRPLIVLMDIDLPGMSGIKATALLKRFLPDIQVIIVSASDDHERILEALKAGARGFLLKPSAPPRRHQSRSVNPFDHALTFTTIARRVAETLHKIPAKPKRSKEPSILTVREAQVTRLISEGLSNKEIAELMNITTLTVKGYIQVIFKKLNVRSRTEVAVKHLKTLHQWSSDES